MTSDAARRASRDEDSREAHTRGADAGAIEGAERMRLPDTIFGYVWEVSREGQIWLCVGSIISFLLSLVPLEMQRRVVNEALEQRQLRTLASLCAVYIVTALVAGWIKRWINVYRGIVSERATLALRKKVHAAVKPAESNGDEPKEKEGTTVSVAVAEVEPVGGFVGMAISEPLLQGGILVFTFAYLVYLQPWMGLLSIVLFSPQLFFVPRMQAAINRRAAIRIKTVRKVGAQLIEEMEIDVGDDKRHFDRKITTVLELNIQIYRLKYTMNFYMNSLHHLGVVGVLLIGGWFVIDGRTEAGTIVAFISGLSQLKEPWTDLINYYREATAAQVKYALVKNALEGRRNGAMPAPAA